MATRTTLLALSLLLLSACVPRGQIHTIDHHHTLLHGSADAIYAGCVRGVIRWHYALTGRWPNLTQVAELCNDTQQSFETRPGAGDDL